MDTTETVSSPGRSAKKVAPSVAIIGGGITGLTAAWQLQHAGVEVVVLDAGTRAGGAVQSVRSDGWLHELGPNSMLENSADVTRLIDELGLSEQRVYASSSARKRYVVRAGKLRAMPTSPLRFLGTRLFSLPSKLKILGEPLCPPAPADANESVADFVVRRLGQEFLDYAVNPFVGGVYAGDPRRLSVRYGFPKLWAIEREHGSLIRGAIKRRNTSGGPQGRMFSFAGGLQELPRTMEHLLRGAVQRGRRVLGVRRRSDGWEIVSESAGAVLCEGFAAIVCALPPEALATIRFEGAPELEGLATLGSVQHAPVVSVFTGYRKEAVSHPLDGFGLLMPEVEHGKILGTLFSSTLFPNRAPPGHVALTTFVGGMRQPEFAQLEDGALQSLVQVELERLLGVREEPVFVHLKRWPRAIPQYALGYERLLEVYAAAERAAPGLFIGGNGRDGISLSSCIASGRRLAAAVQTNLGHSTIT